MPTLYAPLPAPSSWTRPTVNYASNAAGSSSGGKGKISPLAAFGILAVIGAGGYGLSRWVKNKRQKDAAAQFGTNPAVNQAVAFRNALNPSGYSWMKDFDGTDEALATKTAAEVTDWKEVMSKYRALYQSDLLSDLQKDLSPSDFAKIEAAAAAGSSGEGDAPSPSPAPEKKGTGWWPSGDDEDKPAPYSGPPARKSASFPGDTIIRSGNPKGSKVFDRPDSSSKNVLTLKPGQTLGISQGWEKQGPDGYWFLEVVPAAQYNLPNTYVYIEATKHAAKK